MNLYLVSTPTIESYVVAKNTEDARLALEGWLRINDYGYFKDREVINVRLIAKEGVNPKDNVVYYIDKLIIDGMTEKSEGPELVKARNE